MTDRSTEPALVRAWYAGAAWLWLLRPLELLYRLLIALRRWSFRTGIRAVYRAPVPIVVVGNITVGGTGKTPVVIALVEALQARGLHPGVVSRGYGAGAGAVFPHRVGADSGAADCGDEPLLIYQRTGAPCVVAPDRPAAVRALLAQEPVDLVLCDDGLQHYALARDFEIALLDAQRMLGNGFCLPAGPLREPAGRLREVDWVLYRSGSAADSAATYASDGLQPLLPNGDGAPPVPGDAVHAVAGIGQPAQFFASLEAMGYRVTGHSFADHHLFVPGDLAGFGDRPVIMTEKDAVKCSAFAGRNGAGTNLWYLKISARLPAALLDRVAALAQPGP
ncbi:tetraacyldisaccharide 4'-kinase [Haliea sp. E1-2-M8]|uniref:tetraacyldisaccharide 4'-kinase n=1 Tax=Haliea sp. E1-2-M8 TaxID=3064706 RepID=UPI002716B236|nr:tetraacyldisaccharide 4'-kinase [Haliea sp. E1-2-M8]MDO8862389.1 tetraacyldisaccharide 4'-kinase [Haliea sp. E1-2-M8]